MEDRRAPDSNPGRESGDFGSLPTQTETHKDEGETHCVCHSCVNAGMNDHVAQWRHADFRCF